MQSIKILIPLHTEPATKSAIRIVIENLLPALKQKVNVNVTWFVYTPDKLEHISNKSENEVILDIHEFHNALEVITKEKPDIIYAGPTWDSIDYAFSLAGKMMNIPVLDLTISGFSFTRSKSKLIKSYLTRFFESSIPTDINKNKKQFMRRGRFFVYKYLFLIKTQRAVGMNVTKIIHQLLIIIRLFLSNNRAIYDSRFANTLHFLDNESLLKTFLGSGFDKSTLIVTGNPMYDETYRKLTQLKERKKDNCIHVLFASSTLYEHGFWTKDQRDEITKDIVKCLNMYKDKIKLIVKIHPSTSMLSEYQALVNSIDSSIPVYQNGDIFDFLLDSDIVISYKFTTAEIYAVLARKPVIICNFFNEDSDMFVKRGLVDECKESSKLVDSIQKCLASSYPKEKERQEFIKEFMYKWDGLASERISESIIELLKSRGTIN